MATLAISASISHQSNGIGRQASVNRTISGTNVDHRIITLAGPSYSTVAFTTDASATGVVYVKNWSTSISVGIGFDSSNFKILLGPGQFCLMPVGASVGTLYMLPYDGAAYVELLVFEA